MIGGVISLAWASFGGGSLGGLLADWERIGVFDYLLPFLMIFALIFVILNAIKIFKDNRAINAVIALAVAFMAIRTEFVPIFFSEIFPRLGIALSIILAILILLGMFIPPEKPGVMYVLLGVAALILVIVLYNTAGALGWGAAYNWRDYISEIIVGVVFLVALAVIVGVTNKTPTTIRPAGWFETKQ